MTWLMRFIRKSRANHQLDSELRFHLEQQIADYIASGIAPDEARRRARREFGGIDQVKEKVHAAHRGFFLETLVQDIRYGVRMLRKSPGFTTVAILTLALGIGATTAIFSVVNAVLLRPLSFPRSDQLVAVNSFNTTLKVKQGSTSYPDFFDWRAQNHVFRSMTAFHYSSYTLTGAARPAHLNGVIVTAGFFATLGVAPQLGRGFLRSEEHKGAHAVVLSDALWRSQFGSDPRIVGGAITLNNKAYTVVGIAPPAFDFPIETPPAELWTTCADDSDMITERGAYFLTVVARLKPGLSAAQAQAEMTRINANLARQYPEADLHYGAAVVEPELQSLVGQVAPALLVLLGAVGCVLLIACANVANLLLARSSNRQREMALRAALGAGPARVIRQLLTESALLALLGGALGMGLAMWGTSGLVRLVPEDIPRISQIQPDARVLLFTFAAAILTGLLFGLAPALQGAKTNLVDTLKSSARGLSGGVQHNRLRGALVIGEVSLALALLMGASLMIQSFARIENVNPGFNPRNVLSFRFSLPDGRYSTPQQKIFYEQALQRLSAVPGVSSAAAAVPLPLSGSNFSISFTIEGRPVATGNEPTEEMRMVSPGYFATMGIPIFEGRDFAPTDKPNSQAVVIINQAFANKYFPHDDPIGKRMKPSFSDSDAPNAPEPMREIVGVVGNVRTRALNRAANPEYFVPYQQGLLSALYVVLRTKAAPDSVVGAAREIIQSMDSSLPLYNVRSVEETLGRSVAEPRFSALLLSIFAALALTLTALGLYGVLSYFVAQRKHEIGVRMALGAQTGDVLRTIMRQAVILAGIGWGVGIAAGFGLTRFISSQLYGIRSTDPRTLAGVTAVIAGVAFLACYIPARRAMKVDPMVALRHE